jgi:hypothetical protein
MRFIPLAIAILAPTAVAITVFLPSSEPLPPIGPRAEATCLNAMQQAAPDLAWAAPNRDERTRGRTPVSVTVGELPFRSGELVSVEGLLHAEFEWVALYPSRAALEDGRSAPWVALMSLWPNEAEWWWRTKGPSVSDRCVRVEGWYMGGAGGHFGAFDGSLDALRLEVWSTPHRPFDTTPKVVVSPHPSR